MPCPAVRPRRRHLAALLEMPRRPDAQATRLPPRSTAPSVKLRRRRLRQPQRGQRRRRTRVRTRYRASARARSAIASAHRGEPARPSRCWIAAVTSATVTPSRHHVDWLALALVVAGARRRSATPDIGWPTTGRCAAGRSGRTRAPTGVPTAAAMCSGPVSPDTTSARLPRRARRRSGDRGRRRQRARAARRVQRPRCASASSPGPHSTTDASPRTSRRNAATSPNAIRRPALVRPRRAGIDQRERFLAPMRRCSLSRASDAHIAQRKRDLGGRRRRRRAAAAGSCGSRARDRRRRVASRLGVERPRALLAQVPDREADHPRRAGRARQHRRLHQALKIERDVVARPARSAPDDVDPRRRAIGPSSGNDAIDPVTRSSNGPVLRVDQPVDPRVRKRRAQRRRRRESRARCRPSAPSRTIRMFIGDVAAMRASRSRVE